MVGGKLGFLLIIPMMVMSQEAQEGCPAPVELTMYPGILYLGSGYNIIEANPDGGEQSSVDPGLNLNRRIFKLTCDGHRKSADDQTQVPAEVHFSGESLTTSLLSTFHGTASYASKLSALVNIMPGYDAFDNVPIVDVTANVQFAASARYQRVAEKISEKESSVFWNNETITYLGTARYMTEYARMRNYSLSHGFVAKACGLPDAYTEADYMAFLEDWGTHVVTSVTLGVREGKIREETRTSFVGYAAQNVQGSLIASGAYDGFNTSVSVNMESFSSWMSSEDSFGRSYSSYIVGSEALDEPIGVTVISMPGIFHRQFWGRLDDYIAADHCTASFDRERVKENMAIALQGYATWKGIEQSTDPEVRIPVTWPDGVYGLPKPSTGCADNAVNDFTWSPGEILQNTPSGGRNRGSPELNLAGWVDIGVVQYYFCMKNISEVETSSRWQWQPGSYCIYKYSQCPQGFESGHIRWDDAVDSYGYTTGALPAGTYGDDTEINFCCRNDDAPAHPIYLPTDNSFMLLARYDKCQLVHGMSVQKEWVFWDKTINSEQSEVHPYNGLFEGGVRLVYCYYHV